jgi:hypothetical protein
MSHHLPTFTPDQNAALHACATELDPIDPFVRNTILMYLLGYYQRSYIESITLTPADIES